MTGYVEWIVEIEGPGASLTMIVEAFSADDAKTKARLRASRDGFDVSIRGTVVAARRKDRSWTDGRCDDCGHTTGDHGYEAMALASICCVDCYVCQMSE